MEVLAFIPARGGSKGVPKKNIRLLAGKPLIAYSIEQAKESKYISRIIVSTESEEIAEIAREWNAEVIKRPEELARDETPTIDTIIHALDYLKKEENYTPDIVVLLQPTSPLRTSEDIDSAIELFLNIQDCLSLVSVTEFDHPPFWAIKIEDNLLKPLFGKEYFRMRRQELPKAYRPNGAIFISTPKVLRKYKTFYTPKTIAYIMPPERSVDIDTEFDFLLAEFLINKLRCGGQNGQENKNWG
ncbi:MAG: acylneuraminate cytidylyltransferase family protein [Thermosipho sp. (in: Bacteria)]|nr:acylneuraminate cytidylyltransferase family protein [Thermosipho sp. (in: thermotogales)]